MLKSYFNQYKMVILFTVFFLMNSLALRYFKYGDLNIRKYLPALFVSIGPYILFTSIMKNHEDSS